jgi:hypothetical protein
MLFSRIVHDPFFLCAKQENALPFVYLRREAGALCILELDPIIREIMHTPATSTAGLRVKTLAAIEVNSDLWHEPFCDVDYEAVRSVIEAACVVTEIPVPQECPEDAVVADDDEVAGLHPGSAALN